jgi:hypothetical protein
MDNQEIQPPGSGANDPAHKDIDAIAFQLERIKTYLVWIDKHRLTFEHLRKTDPGAAEKELRALQEATEQAFPHLQRLMELLLAGYTIDPKKRLPTNLTDFRRILR